MKIVSITWARNESEILEYFVRHNCTVVDRMVIALHRCTDNSEELLCRLRDEGLPIEILVSDVTHHAQGEMLTHVMYRQPDADWILPLDADEFIAYDTNHYHAWDAQFPRDIIKELPTDIVHLLPWKTYIPTPSDDLDEHDPRRCITHRRCCEMEPIYKVLISQQLVHGSCLREGSHALVEVATGRCLPARALGKLWLAHYPVRSEQQLKRKVINGWEAARKNPNRWKGQSFHWRELYERCKDPAPIPRPELQKIASVYGMKKEDINIELIKDPIMSVKHSPWGLQPVDV